MEKLVQSLRQEAIKKRLFAVEETKKKLISGNITTEKWNLLIEPLVEVLRDNNFKICRSSLECIGLLIQQVGEAFQPYGSSVLPAVIDRLGDSKESVRDEAVNVLMRLAQISGLDFVLGRLQAHVNHRSWRVRQQLLVVVSKAAEEYGEAAAEMEVLDMLIRSMEDSSSDVRKQAFSTAAQLYTVLGSRLVTELESRGLRTSVLQQIQERIQCQEISIKEPPSIAIPTSSKVSGGSAKSSPMAVGSKRSTSRPKNGSLRRNNSQENQHVKIEVELIDGDVITPVEVYTEKEMIEKLESIGAALGKAQDDKWQVRLAALQMLHGLALGGAPSYTSFVTQVRQVVGSEVGSQLADLRSQIVKEACRAVSAVATTTAEAFGPLAEIWLPALLKLVPQTIRVMSLSGDRCAKSIMISSKNGFPKVLLILLQSYSSKNQTVRFHSIVYVMIALIHWNITVLERHLDGITTMIRTAVADADARVRSQARLCFWALHERSKTHADTLMMELDMPTQRRLLQDEAVKSCICVVRVDPTDKDAPRATSGGRANPSHARQPNEKRIASAPSFAPCSGRSTGTGALRIAVPSSGKEESKGFSTALSDEKGSKSFRSAPADDKGRKAPSTRAVRIVSSTSNSNVGQNPKAKVQTEVKEERDKKVGAMRRVVPTQPLQIATQNQAPTERFHQTIGGGASRSLGGGAARIAVPAQEDKQQKTVQKENKSKRSSLLAKRVALPSDQNERPKTDEKDTHVRSMGPMRIQHLIQDTPDDTKMEEVVEESLPNVQDNKASSNQQLTPLKDLIRMGASDHWATRLQCFEDFMILLREDLVAFTKEKTARRNMINLAIEHILDKHYKVSLCALHAVGMLLDVAPSLLHNVKSDILLKVFVKLVDQKPQTRAEANKMLLKLREAYDVSGICGSICPHLMELPDKARSAALEFIASLCPSAPTYLTVPQNSRGLIQQLSSMAHSSSRGSQVLQESALALLLAIHRMDSGLFEAQVYSLPDQAQTKVKNVLKDHIPSLSKGVLHVPRNQGPSQNKSQTTKAAPNRVRKGQINQLPPACKRRVGSENRSPNNKMADCFSPEDDFLQEPLDHLKENQTNPFRPPSVPARSPLSEITNTTASPLPQCHFSKPSNAAAVPPLLQALGAGGKPGQSERLLAMRQIVEISKENDPEVWSKYFSQILLLLLEGLRGSNRENPQEYNKGFAKLRQSSLLTLSSMIINQGDQFSDFMEIVFDSLMDCCRDPAFEVVHTSELNLERLIGKLNPERSFVVLLPYISQTSIGAIRLSSIKILCKLLPRMSSPYLLGQMQSLMPHLTTAFKSQSAEIRKAVVYALVEIYRVLGDHLFTYLNELTSTQKKLVTIYINKRDQTLPS